MSDIKKKFLDILFEPDVEEVEAEAPLEDVKGSKEENVEEVTDVKSPNVKDVIYGKQDKPSSFIDYFEVPRKEKPNVLDEEPYEMRENVSPIFGLIAQKEQKKKAANELEIQKAITGSSEYAGIVLSPIYGFDESKANDARKILAEKHIKETKERIKAEINLEEEIPFEIPEDMNETIKEAIQEAVVELNPNMYADVPRNNPETFENPIEEEKISEVIEVENIDEDKLEKEYEEVMDDYNFDEEVINEPTNIESGSYDEPFATTEELKIIENEEVEKKKKVSRKKETKEKNYGFKANRSIYDTTPIQLFDFDDITNKDYEKDLFDELIGDDD